MTPEGRRAARRLAFTAISAAAGYAVSGASARQALRVPLAVLAVAALGNLGVQVKTASKAYATESRFNNLINNGGSFGGNVVVNGNHTITGSLFGSAGTITAGDAIHVNGNPLTADGTITSHADINATTGTITGGTVVSNGDVQATSGTVHAGGLSTTGAVHGGSTTGDSSQGNLTALSDSSLGSAAAGWETAAQNRINDILNYLQGAQNSSQNATINRVNDLLSALG